jgi:hypothetical protein
VRAKLKVAPAAILGVVIVTWPERPLRVAVVVPEAVPELRTIPLPAAVETKFPAVAVILPRVAVNVVVAVNEPVTAVLPVALPIRVAPVPPVPIVVMPAPVTLIFVAPVCVRAPRVVRPPVAVNVVPITAEVVTARDVPDVNVVVEAMLPGAMNTAGIVNVIVLPDPAVVIWLAVPKRLIFPPEGLIGPPLDAVRVTTPPVAPVPNAIQLPVPGHINADRSTVSSHSVPLT